jgi:hypothetical protein
VRHRQEMPPRFRGGEAASFRRRKKTQIGLVVLRIKHATDLSDSNLLIWHYLVVLTLKAARFNRTGSVRKTP